MTRPPSELDVLHAEHLALSVAMHARPPANPVRVWPVPPRRFAARRRRFSRSGSRRQRSSRE